MCSRESRDASQPDFNVCRDSPSFCVFFAFSRPILRLNAGSTRSKNAAQNLATLRRLALNLLRNDSTRKVSLRQKRMFAALDPDHLKQLLAI